MTFLTELDTLSAINAYDRRQASLNPIDWTIATVADIGTSLWNSVTFGQAEVSTEALLGKLGADGAMQAYNTHRDSIELASFVGGMIIPGMAAVKLTKAVRDGNKAFYAFSSNRRTDDLAKMKSLIEDGKRGQAEYRAVRNGMILRGQANNLADTVAAELAIMGTMNAHPFMEDYMADPVKNFGIGLLIGGGLTAPFTAIGTRSAIRSMAGGVESAAIGDINRVMGLTELQMADTSSTLNSMARAADDLEHYIAQPGISTFTKELGTDMVAMVRAGAGQVAKGKLPKDLGLEEANWLKGLLESSQFLGADSAKFYAPPKQGFLAKAKAAFVPRQDTPDYVLRGKDADGNAVEELVSRHFFAPDLGGSFIPNEHVGNLASAADAHTAASIAARAKKFSKNEMFGKYDELMLKNSAEVEAEYLARNKFYSDMSVGDLTSVSIVGDDLPAIHGWFQAIRSRKVAIADEIAKLDPLDPLYDAARKAYVEELAMLDTAKLGIHSGDQMRLVRADELTGTRAMPTNEQMKARSDAVDAVFNPSGDGKKSFKPIIAAGSYDVVGAGNKFSNQMAGALGVEHGNMKAMEGIGAQTYYATFQRLANEGRWNKWSMDNMFPAGHPTSDLSPAAKAMLGIWVGGKEADKKLIRQGLESARTLRKGQHSDTVFHDEWAEILSHPYVVRQQKAIANLADTNGNLHLWRGTTTTPSGQASFSSFSQSPGKATTFGEVNLYSLHSDDILGYVTQHEKEFLVGSSTLDFRHIDDTAKKASATKPLEFSYKEAITHYMELANDGLKQAAKDGIPLEVAALRHNMTPDQAMAFLGSDRNMPKVISKMMADDTNEAFDLISRWQKPDQLDVALSTERRIVEVSAVAKHHLGDQGRILEAQRNAINSHTKMSSKLREAVNRGDNLGAEFIKSKLNVFDNLYAGIRKEWMDLTLASSDSAMARSLLNNVVNSDMINLIKANLDQVVNSKGGNSFYQSADMVMRNMDQIGRAVASVGDMRTDVVNSMIIEYMEPVATSFKQLGKDPAARAEFAMLDQFRQATKGPLHWDSEAKRFYTHIDENGVKNLVGPPATTPAAISAMDSMEAIGRELYAARATKARLGNGNTPQDIGTWIPSNRLLGKEYAYVQDMETHQIKLLVADTTEGLNELKSAYKMGQNERVISRTRAELENLAVMDDGRIQKVTLADVDKAKRGIGVATPDISIGRLEDIATGYTAQLNRVATSIMEEAMHDVVQRLDYMSALGQQAVTDSGKTGWRKSVAQLQNKDIAGDVKDYLLGRNPAHRNEFLRTVNQASDTVISYAAKAATRAWEVVRPERLGDPVDYEKYLQTLSAQGVPNPFHAFAVDEQAREFAKARVGGYQTDPQRVVNAFNALASTTALKFLEIAQPLINLMSTPILMSSAISRMGDMSKIDGAGFFANSQMAVMMNGVRRANSRLPQNQRLFALAKEEGLLTSQISEVDEALRMAKLGQDTGGVTKLENILNHKLVELLSTPSVIGEELTRKTIFGTGVELAYRQLGAKATDTQVMIFARDFMKQANGNYSAAQRPAMFQGSFGSAMGLFQTYMVTYAQNMYSHIEKADRAGLTKMMLFQGGIFGTYSLPGFNPISEAIGKNFSDEHVDLKTGLYRALPDALSNALIYGMPSNLLGALHTRGDVSPRIPSGFFEFVAPSMLLQYADTVVNVAKGASRFDENAGHAMLEALSVQSASRPVARFAELLNGYSVTAAGKQVAGSEEVWSFQGVMSRVLSTRTLAEAQAREVMHLNTVYGQKDRDLRQSVMRNIRQDLRNGELSNDRLGYYAHEYLRSGSPQGFRSAVNEAYLEADNKGIIDLSGVLKDSPLTMLLDDIDL